MNFNQNWVRCPVGHYYDSSKFHSCPICAQSAPENPGYSPIEPAAPADIGATQPSGNGFDDYEPTQPPQPEQASGYVPAGGAFGTYPQPVPPSASHEQQHYGDDTDPMAGEGEEPEEEAAPVQPVTGWLVCLAGPNRGRDWPIHEGYNTIGSDSCMDIRITGDEKISPIRHAMLAFDPEELKCYFAPGGGKSLVKLNGKTLMMPMELHAYDTLTIGSYQFKFAPFCGPEFSWNDEG